MKALVTGATGFIGGLVADRLVTSGHRVTALVREPGRAKELEAFGIRLATADLTSADGIDRALADHDVVFHVAGLVKARSTAEFTQVNVGGTQTLVRASTRLGIPRFVHVSSMAACGPSRRDRPLSGDEPPRPVTPYGRSKLAGEQVVRESDLHWTIVRPPMVYGPRDRELLRVFRACRLGIVPVFGDGEQQLCAAYGPDLADALLSVAGSERTIGRTYFACHPERFTSERFAREVARAVGRVVRIVRVPAAATRAALHVTGLAARLVGRATLLHADKAAELLADAWTADPAPLEADAGWVARHDLRSGVDATAAWYHERGWLRRP